MNLVTATRKKHKTYGEGEIVTEGHVVHPELRKEYTYFRPDKHLPGHAYVLLVDMETLSDI